MARGSRRNNNREEMLLQRLWLVSVVVLAVAGRTCTSLRLLSARRHGPHGASSSTARFSGAAGSAGLKKLVVEPIPKISGEITLPGSKSLSNRVLLLAALSKGTTKVENLLDSEDIRYMLAALQQLGVPIDEDKAKKTAVVTGRGGTINVAAKTDLFLGNAGTAMRPLTGVLCAGQGEFVLDGTPRMRERPIVDLIDGLKQLGVDVSCSATGCPPVVIKARGIKGFFHLLCSPLFALTTPPPRLPACARRRDRHLRADLLAVPVSPADDRPVGHGRRGDAHQGRADVRPVRAHDA